jgi:hypothetical protein
VNLNANTRVDVVVDAGLSFSAALARLRGTASIGHITVERRAAMQFSAVNDNGSVDVQVHVKVDEHEHRTTATPVVV